MSDQAKNEKVTIRIGAALVVAANLVVWFITKAPLPYGTLTALLLTNGMGLAVIAVCVSALSHGSHRVKMVISQLLIVLAGIASIVGAIAWMVDPANTTI